MATVTRRSRQQLPVRAIRLKDGISWGIAWSCLQALVRLSTQFGEDECAKESSDGYQPGKIVRDVEHLRNHMSTSMDSIAQAASAVVAAITSGEKP